MNAAFRKHIKQNWHLAYPVMLSQLGHVAMGFTDNVMVGHLGAVSLAAAGLATVIFNVFMLFGIGVSYAITPLVAEAQGEGDNKRISETLRHGLVINFVTGISLVCVVYFGKQLLFHLQQPAEVVSQALPYLDIITVSLIPMLLFQTFRQVAEGMSKTKVAMVVIIATNIINVFMNYLLIYGNWGFPALGLEGAGWATLSSRIFMMISIALYVYFAHFFRPFRDGFSFRSYSGELFKKMLHIGIPSGAQFIFEVAAFDFSLVMMGWLGTKGQAAHQIAINLATISYMTTSGLAAAATIRVGYFLGSKDIRNLKMAASSILTMAIGIMLIWTTIFISARHVLPQIYIADEEVITIASTLLIIAGLFQLADGIQVVCVASLRGLQDVRIPSLFIFVAYWIIGLPLGYWLAFHAGYGAIGVWIGLLIGLTLTASAMYVRLRTLSNRLF